MILALKGYFNSINFNEFNIVYGGNGAGKTEIFTKLMDGFSGKLKNQFLVNGNSVLKNEYSVLSISESDNFYEELKLSNKSYLKKEIEERISNFLDDDLVKLKIEIEEEIKKKILFQFDFLDDVSIDFRLNLSEIIIKNIILNSDYQFGYSFSQLRKSQINTILNQDINENTIILVDHFDMGLSNFEREELMKRFRSLCEVYRCTIILFTSNFSEFTYYDKFVVNRNLYNSIIDIIPEKYLLGISKEDVSLFSDEEINGIKNKNLKIIFDKIKKDIEKNKKDIVIK